MPYPNIVATKADVIVPWSVKGLDPENILLFALMSIEDAARCMEAGALLSTRELFGHPDHRPVGDPALIAARLRRPMPSPLAGYVGDNVVFNFTSRTAAAYASCGPKQPEGAIKMSKSDFALFVVELNSLQEGGVPMTCCVRAGAELVDEPRARVPWDDIRDSRFMKGLCSDVAGYHAEILVPVAVSIEAYRVGVVVADATAAKLLTQRSMALGRGIAPLIRPALFVGS